MIICCFHLHNTNSVANVVIRRHTDDSAHAYILTTYTTFFFLRSIYHNVQEGYAERTTFLIFQVFLCCTWRDFLFPSLDNGEHKHACRREREWEMGRDAREKRGR